LKSGKLAIALMARNKAIDSSKGNAQIEALLTAWKEILDQRLPPKETNEAIDRLISSSGIEGLTDIDGKPLALARDLLDRTYTKGKPDVYLAQLATGSTKIYGKPPTEEEINKDGVVSYQKVTVDISKFLTNKERTLLNTVVVSALPAEVRNSIDAYTTMLKKTIAGFNSSNGRGDDKEFYFSVDSPARGLVFSNTSTSGNPVVSPQTAAAMWFVTMETISTDKFKLILGNASKADVATQLGITEDEVTDEQMKFAKTHGMLGKSLANSLGKSILAELGLGKKSSDDVGKGHYESLAADLGNMAIAVGINLGWFEEKTATVAEVTKFYGNKLADGADGSLKVQFINLKVPAKSKELVGAVANAAKVYEGVGEMLPTVKAARRGFFKGLTEEQIDRNLNSIRNDLTGGTHKIPAEAQTALRNMMNTKFTVDIPSITRFLADVDANPKKVMSLFGWIELKDGNPKYDELTFEKKDIQVGINRDIERSIEELRKVIANTTNGQSFDVNYLFYYTSNGRYMIDSNTINPQTDKIHRFLVQPSAHRLTHEVVGKGGAAKFSVGRSELGAGKDTSYGVRLALAQAFGYDIDKNKTKDIIKFSNTLLSLDAAGLAALREGVLNSDDGKYKVTDDVTVEAVHLTHLLQGVDFLEQVLKGGPVTSSLTAEFDSVTNGFMNKLMQFPILDKMKEYLARVGILYDGYLDDNSNGTSLRSYIDLDKGEAVNSILSKSAAKDTGFLDSYKNLASTVANGIIRKLQGTNLAKYKEFLPLPDEDGDVSALRSMFKSPFMTFNYSASIKSITTSLSENMAKELVEKVAAGNRELAMLMLQDGISIGKDAKGKPIVLKADENGVNALIKAFRTMPPSSIRMGAKGSVEEVFAGMFATTYGELVKTAFETNFKPYIELQDYINDAFKISYRLFHKEFAAKLQEMQRDGAILTEQSYKDAITQLWDKFPAIKGPLSDLLEGYDAIPVVSSNSTSSTMGVDMRDTVQTKLQKNGKTTSKVVHAVMRFLDEANKAGSVLPFHYIDGAELGRMLNALVQEHGTEAGITPIHDAIMAPITLFDDATWQYNKQIVDVNKKYSIIDTMVDMATKWGGKDNYKDLNVDGLQAAKNGKGKPHTAEIVVSKVLEGLQSAAVLIRENRDSMLFGKAASSHLTFNNMVGSAGGYYKVGDTGPHKEYLNYVNTLYVNEDLNKSEEPVSKPVTITDKNNAAAIAKARARKASVGKTC
jgi:hypothetical protein